MASGNIFLGISNIVTGLLVIAISIPLVLGKVSMNRIYGIRFKKSYASNELWYKINAHGGKLLIIWSVPLILSGIACFFIDFQHRPMLGSVMACMPLIVLIPAVLSWRYAKKL